MNTEELTALCPLFRGIQPEDLDALLHCLSARSFSPERAASSSPVPARSR